MIEVKERPKARSNNMAFHIRKIGVIGAGQMGSGIAHVSSLAGFEVKLNDLSSDRIKAGIATINGNMARQAKKSSISEEQRQAALRKITPAETLDALSDDAAAACGRVLPRIARAVLGATGARAYNVLQNNGADAHQAVLHVHFHIIPRFDDGTGLGIGWKAAKLVDGAELARAIAAKL